MQTLKIELLGPLQISCEGRPIPKFPTHKAQAIFSFLILNRTRFCARNVLAGTFWEERSEESARKCLRTELWRIRSTLKPTREALNISLEMCNDGVRVRLPEDAWLDVAEFENRLASLQNRSGSEITPEEALALKEAVELYRGDFFEGNYDEWCLQPRERLRQLFLLSLERLMEHYQASADWSKALTYGQQLLQQDPLLEHVHRNVMRCYRAMGNRAMALRQFETVAEQLRVELDIEPMEETEMLHQEIKAHPRLSPRDLPKRSFAVDQTQPLGSEEILDYLNVVHNCLEELLQPLRQVIEASERALTTQARGHSTRKRNNTR